MIDLRQKALNVTRGWQRVKIKYGFTFVPDYACATLAEFLGERDNIAVGKTLVFPRLSYTPLEFEERLSNEVLVKLSDPTASAEMYVSRTCFNEGTRAHMGDIIDNLSRGTSLVRPVLRNGNYVPYQEPDQRIFLVDFEKRGPSQKKKGYAGALAEMMVNLFSEPASALAFAS